MRTVRLPSLRRPPRSRVYRILSIAVAMLIAAGLLLLGFDRLTGLPADAALRVDDTVVTTDEVDRRISAFRALYGVQSPGGEKADEFRRDSAKAVAMQLVLDVAARDRGIVISDKAARDALTNLVEDQLPTEGWRGFVALLGEVGASEEDVLTEVKRQHATAELLHEVTKDVAAPAADEVRQAFDERADEMVTPERRKVRNIVVATEREAKRALRELRSGAGFAALVARRSLDGSTRDTGGNLGFVSRDQLEPAYADAAFGVAAGEYFGPVETRFGWNVGQVRQIREPKPLRYADVKEEFRAALTSERQLKAWRAWLAEQLQDADIDYADDYRPADPDVPPAETFLPEPR